MDELKTVSFSVFRDRVDTLLLAFANLIDRDFPPKLTAIPGLQPYLLVAMKVLTNTYGAIRYLSADLPKDPSRKAEYGLATPPLVRCIADLISTIVFISEDLAKRTDWYHRGGWRELREDYERHLTEYGTLPEWQPFIKSYKTALDEGAKRIGITPSEAAAWGKIPYWPTPPQMLAKTFPITKQNRDFLQYVQDWLYRGLSQKAHMSAAGIVQAHSFLLLKEEEGREQRLQKIKSDNVFTALTLVVSFCSEVNWICGFGRCTDLAYIWRILIGFWGEAKDLYDRRYAAMFMLKI